MNKFRQSWAIYKKSLSPDKEDMDLLNTALQDIYSLICCGRVFEIKQNTLIGIIMLNMKFWWAKSGWKSSNNIASTIVSEVLGNPNVTKADIIHVLRNNSNLDISKFKNPKDLEQRKKWASCPLYAFKDSNIFIQKLWEIAELVLTIINLRFQKLSTKEELFLSGQKL